VEWLSALCGLVRGELTKLMRGSLVALITIDVHNRDIIDYLVKPPLPPSLPCSIGSQPPIYLNTQRRVQTQRHTRKHARACTRMHVLHWEQWRGVVADIMATINQL
jgi:hypothetical protein